MAAVGDCGGDERRIYNVRLAKWTGLHQMLDPEAARVCGHNAYHLLIYAVAAYIGLVSAVLVADGLHSLSDGRETAAFLSLVSAESYVFTCYKMLAVVWRSREIGDCLRSVTRFGFTALGRRDARLSVKWRTRSVMFTNLYAVMCVLTTVLFVASPAVYRGKRIAAKAPDGTVGHYRINMLNLYVLMSADAYNAHYGAMYAIETACILLVGYVYVIFDVLLMTLCFSTSCQFQTINSAFESSGTTRSLSTTRGGAVQNDDDDEPKRRSNNNYCITKLKTSDEHCEIYKNLITTIQDHQEALMNLEKIFSTFRIILPQIVVSSNLLIISWFIIIKYFIDEEFQARSGGLMLKMLFICPALTFQLFMTCYLFEFIHGHKESVIFALYSSNWTEMDMKCKKMILLTMSMNNAHRQKLKFTQERIVNMDLFYRTMRVCYSILSVLLNYKSTSD